MAELPPAARRAMDSAVRALTREIPIPALYDRLSNAERVAVRRQYEESQDGMCYYCQWPLSAEPRADVREVAVDWSRFPGGRSFLAHPVHLHHCHRTGLTIGAVHALCNAVLWLHHGE